MTPPDAHLAALLRIERQLADLPGRIAAALSAGRGHDALSPADRQVLGELLEPLLGAVGEGLFTLAELRDQAARWPELHAALQHLEADGRGPRSLGKLLARASGRDIGGAVVWRRGTERGSAVWQLQRLKK